MDGVHVKLAMGCVFYVCGSFLVMSRSTAALARTAMGVSSLLVWIMRPRSNSPLWLYRPRAVPHVAQLTPAYAYCAACACGIMRLGSAGLTGSMLHQLKSFQGEIGRRILKLSKYHSTLSTRLALRWPSV